MNRDQFQQLSRLREREAKQLFAFGHYAGSYYLLGYAVECALKARIARTIGRYQWPPKRTDKHYSHHLPELLTLASMNPQSTTAARQLNWTIVKDWSSESRYLVSKTEIEARDFRDACVRRGSGVLAWIREGW